MGSKGVCRLVVRLWVCRFSLVSRLGVSIWSVVGLRVRRFGLVSRLWVGSWSVVGLRVRRFGLVNRLWVGSWSVVGLRVRRPVVQVDCPIVWRLVAGQTRLVGLVLACDSHRGLSIFMKNMLAHLKKHVVTRVHTCSQGHDSRCDLRNRIPIRSFLRSETRGLGIIFVITWR